MRAVVGPDGTVYRDKAVAAAALGVHRETIRRHLKRYGSLATIGCSWARRVEHAGICWLSIEYAAEALGFAPNTISYHLARWGHLERLGRGADANGFGKNGLPARGRPVPFECGPLRWESQKEAAAELGIAPGTVWRWSHRKARPQDREKLLRLVMQAQLRRESAR